MKTKSTAPKVPNVITTVNPAHPMEIQAKLHVNIAKKFTKVNAGLKMEAAAEVTLAVTTAEAATTLRSTNSR